MKTQEVIGKFIRRTRKKKGWSLTELETKSGIPFQVISDIELGKKNTGIETFFRLLSALKADFTVSNGKII